MGASKQRRSKFYVDHEVQTALAKRVALHWLVFVVVCFVLVGILQACIAHPSVSFKEMFLFALQRNFIPLMVGLAMVPVFVYDTIRVTNRFAGPIARLRETLRDISSGSELRELKLRQGDYWSELAQEFNQAMRRLTKSTAETSK